MANRMKEDEKNEKIIRGLLKLPANRKCINCNNLGPQYVCTNFWTFICTNCSGIHREFTHRVKSISMAKFTTQEVIALQEGGNERAKETYFKEFDSQRHSVPDSSNIDRLRDFIKHVYVHRRYSGEKNAERPPIAKQGDREDSSDNKSVDSYRGGSRSPPFNDRYSERAGYGGRSEMRSPGYDGFDYKKSPGRFEVVDEKRRDDRFGTGDNNRRFEERTFPVPKPEGRSPNHQKEISALSPPMVRPVRDILGDDAPTLRVGDPPKSNGTTIPDNVGQTQRSSSFSGTGSSDGTSVQLKRANSGSLIDFNADPEPPVSVPQQTTSAPAGGNWASFDLTGQQKSPQAVENATSLESALAQLSTPGTALGGSMSTLPISGIDSFPKIDNGGPNMQQQQPSLFPSSNNQFTNPQFNVPAVGVVNQTWGSSLTPNLHTSLSAPAGYPSQVAPRPPQEMSAGVLSQPPAEAKPSSRKALPEDLFAALYPMAPTSAPSWQGRPYHGMGYGMQYPAGMFQMMPTYPLQSQSSNPFDMINEQASVQAPMFPSMSPLQGALPNMGGPSGILRTSSLGNPAPRWIPPQQPAYPPALSQSPYMLQQVPSHMAQQVPNSMTPMGYSQPGTPNSFGGGNPFG